MNVRMSTLLYYLWFISEQASDIILPVKHKLSSNVALRNVVKLVHQ